MSNLIVDDDVIKLAEAWSRKQKRLYWALNTFLIYWINHDYQILRIDLTSSFESNTSNIRKKHIQLRRKVEKEFGFKNIHDFVVETTEGAPGAVLHCLWAYRGEKPFYVPHVWLSKNWEKLYKAKIVYVKMMDNDYYSRKDVSRYIVSHYFSSHGDALKRYSYSWRRTFDFPVAKYWKLFKKYWLEYAQVDYNEMLILWEYFLKGDILPDVVKGMGYWLPTVEELRGQKIEK